MAGCPRSRSGYRKPGPAEPHAVAAPGFAASFAQAEVPSWHASPAPLDIAAALNIDTARAQVVQSILEGARMRGTAM